MCEPDGIGTFEPRSSPVPALDPSRNRVFRTIKKEKGDSRTVAFSVCLLCCVQHEAVVHQIGIFDVHLELLEATPDFTTELDQATGFASVLTLEEFQIAFLAVEVHTGCSAREELVSGCGCGLHRDTNVF